MTALTTDNIVVVPIRSGLGLRLGANIGHLKFTPQPTSIANQPLRSNVRDSRGAKSRSPDHHVGTAVHNIPGQPVT
jgi:hypothetical protein